MTRAPVVWLTGLPASGKSTLANALSAALQADGTAAEVIDGDDVRETISRDLGFSKADREEQARRVAALADRIAGQGTVAIVALVSPYRAARAAARASLPAFIEVYVECALPELLARDPKGHYREALAGRRPHFTGVDDPYEPPDAPDVHVRTDRETVDECVRRIERAVIAQRDLRP